MSDYQLTIGQLLVTPLANAGGQEIVDAGGARFTYRQFRDRVGRLASMLAHLGVREGSVVAWLDWDSHRYLEAFFAVPMMGATLHTVNVRLAPDQVLYTINHAADDVIVTHADFLPLLAAIRDRITRPVTVVVMEGEAGADQGYDPLMAAADPGFAFPALAETTRATLFYTTGTTGDPKGVSFSHRQIVLHTFGTIAALAAVPPPGGIHKADVYMPVTPMFHVHAWGVPYVATLLGMKQVYPGRYDPARLIALKQAEGVTFTHCVPTILQMILTSPAAEGADLSGWKVIIGGSALTPGLARVALRRGIEVFAGYGMSETCPILTLADVAAAQGLPEDEAVALRCGTGKAVPLVELSIRGEGMAALPHDGAAQGELCVRAPWLTEGYLRDPERSADLWAGGWLHTGDVGAVGEDGTLRLGDRLKDTIKSGGEWISSLALEAIGSGVEGVAEVAAIGLPDARWGERPCLVAVAKPGAEAGAVTAGLMEAVAAAIRAGHLPGWAHPDRIELVEALPRTSVGKLDKKRMRVQFAGP